MRRGTYPLTSLFQISGDSNAEFHRLGLNPRFPIQCNQALLEGKEMNVRVRLIVEYDIPEDELQNLEIEEEFWKNGALNISELLQNDTTVIIKLEKIS